MRHQHIPTPSSLFNSKDEEMGGGNQSVACEWVVKETLNFDSIPYADYFEVKLVWKASSSSSDSFDNHHHHHSFSPTNDHESPSPSSSYSSIFSSSSSSDRRRRRPFDDQFGEGGEGWRGEDVGTMIKVEVLYEITFIKSTWLRGQIERNTKSELLVAVERWEECVRSFLNEHKKKRGEGSEGSLLSTINHLIHQQQQDGESSEFIDQMVVDGHPTTPIRRVSSSSKTEEEGEEDEFYECYDEEMLVEEGLLSHDQYYEQQQQWDDNDEENQQFMLLSSQMEEGERLLFEHSREMKRRRRRGHEMVGDDEEEVVNFSLILFVLIQALSSSLSRLNQTLPQLLSPNPSQVLFISYISFILDDHFISIHI